MWSVSATWTQMQPADALKVGFFQALALIPGTSRAAATIIGGLLIGMSRRAATEFSFFVAIPTMLAATGYKLWEARDTLSFAEAQPLAISSAVAFVSALAQHSPAAAFRQPAFLRGIRVVSHRVRRRRARHVGVRLGALVATPRAGYSVRLRSRPTNPRSGAG